MGRAQPGWAHELGPYAGLFGPLKSLGLASGLLMLLQSVFLNLPKYM
jgi:hypothetical protein